MGDDDDDLRVTRMTGSAGRVEVDDDGPGTGVVLELGSFCLLIQSSTALFSPVLKPSSNRSASCRRRS